MLSLIPQSMCVHSGAFHADDVFAVAMLRLLNPELRVWRSRDPQVWARCDVLADVGDEYIAEKNRFDHHQKGFSERRPNGIPYAGAGLVWRSWGSRIVGHVAQALASDVAAEDIAQQLDGELIQYVDALDNGVAVDAPPGFSIAGLIASMVPGWLEDHTQMDVQFEVAVTCVTELLRGAIRSKVSESAGQRVVAKAELAEEGRLLILPVAGMPYEEHILAHEPQCLYAMYPSSDGGRFNIKALPTARNSFVSKKQLPEAWAGLRDASFAQVSGVPDAIFCHNGRFFAAALSYEGAYRLAQLAIHAN